ncbi:Septin-domain-containing protein [Rhodofomes roseus]|uniref:Septin-domain-containing protein n=1 Tax=Rhodofomes roseus TaxID=34475 RepID=A0ABQ8KUD1_9APHY|nr:Septin-domain-containing protein [Rhodofomes roseus]KAH9841618.1 Septin-domain-containing protein [Rhodofomes roseus]
MFSFRRKSRKSEADHDGPPFVRHSPSLPELTAQGIPWPEHLVDLSAVPDAAQQQTPPKGAAKTVFDTEVQGPIPFHVPWSSPGKPAGGPISSLYMSTTPPPPSAYETRKLSHSRPKLSLRKARAPTTFNIMVAGSQGTGKTSLLRLLLDTADISPTATPEQRTAMEHFLRGTPKRTDSIQSTCIEICESRYDRVLLSVIDTPGLDFQEGHELKLERQVSTVVKYMDTQFSDTLSEESKVIRQSKGDQHIHLCIYMIDPKSIITTSLRRALSSLPVKSRSEATISKQTNPPDLSFSDSTSEDEDEEADADLKMSPADIRVIRRLSTRANVLPVLARADSLTDDTLAEMKRVVRRDLLEAGLDFGVFGPINPETPTTAKPGTNGDSTATGNGNGHGNGNGNGKRQGSNDTEESEPEEDPEERRSRPVIKLRGTRGGTSSRARSQSRSRVTLSELAARERAEPDATDVDSVASVRFSASVVVKSDFAGILPFALISPERVKRRRTVKPSLTPLDQQSMQTDTDTGSGVAPSEDGHAQSVADSAYTSPTTPSTPSSVTKHFPYLAGPPADLRGVFIRKFRWGTVDVLNPQHCDFAAMRTAVLSTYMKMLKIRTNEVLYEKFRTEKLLARRATANISEHETRKLLKDLGL